MPSSLPITKETTIHLSLIDYDWPYKIAARDLHVSCETRPAEKISSYYNTYKVRVDLVNPLQNIVIVII